MKNAIIDFETNECFGYGFADIRKGQRHLYIRLNGLIQGPIAKERRTDSTIKIHTYSPRGNRIVSRKGEIVEEGKRHLYIRLNRKL
jgi:hypothetical protein